MNAIVNLKSVNEDKFEVGAALPGPPAGSGGPSFGLPPPDGHGL